MAAVKVSTAPDDGKPREYTAAARYEALAVERQPYLERARECSRLTIPSLLPPEGHSGHSSLYRPWQSVGADCVNNLAAKLLLTLFPPGSPFFRLSVDDFIIEDFAAMSGSEEDVRGELEKVLGKIERAVVNHMEVGGTRKTNFETALHLIVTGNGLQYVDPEGKVKFFPLDRYVVSRDLDDNVLEIVVRECIAKDALPAAIREVVDRNPGGAAGGHSGPSGRKDVEVYTWVKRQENGTWRVHQEVCGEIVPGTEGTYPAEKCAWIPLRWTKIAGESYGRGRCEEYLGDLYSYEALEEAITRFTMSAAKIVVMVDESGTTSAVSIAEAASGDVIDGRASDVTFLHMDKDRDFAIAKALADDKRARLERGFLNAASVQRHAERVTAEEIRLMAGELEQGLGGTYSILGEEWQRPLVSRLLHVLPKIKGSRVPELPDRTVNPQIITGLDGLGRNTDMMRLDALIQGTGEVFGAEAVARYINVGAYMTRRAAALGIDIDGLIRSEEEVQAEIQQAQMMQVGESLGGPAIKALSDNMIAAQKNQQAGVE